MISTVPHPNENCCMSRTLGLPERNLQALNFGVAVMRMIPSSKVRSEPALTWV